MKKSLLTSTLLLSIHCCFSQEKIEYANFIQADTAVKWAAMYNSIVNLTPVNPNYNIGNFYFNRIKKESLLTYSVNNIDFSLSARPYTYKEMVDNLNFSKYDPEKINMKFNFDENHDASESILYNESNACDTCFDNKLCFIKVKQLLYYKNHQLRIKNILIDPLVYKKQPENRLEETMFSETIDVAFDGANSDKNIIPAAATFIGRTCNMLDLGLNGLPENKILTIKNWSLCSLLYKDLQLKKIQAYSTENGIYPAANSILSGSKIDGYHNEQIQVQIYDSIGEPIGYKMIMSDVNYDSCYHFKLVQDFYFDFNSEKMYSKPIALIPQMNIVTNQGISLGLADHWGIIFPQERKKAPLKKK